MNTITCKKLVRVLVATNVRFGVPGSPRQMSASDCDWSVKRIDSSRFENYMEFFLPCCCRFLLSVACRRFPPLLLFSSYLLSLVALLSVTPDGPTTHPFVSSPSLLFLVASLYVTPNGPTALPFPSPPPLRSLNTLLTGPPLPVCFLLFLLNSSL